MSIDLIRFHLPNGIQFSIDDEWIRWTVDGQWHSTTHKKFEQMLKKFCKPKKQKRE